MQELSRYIILRDKNAELRRRVEHRNFPRFPPGPDMFGPAACWKPCRPGGPLPPPFRRVQS